MTNPMQPVNQAAANDPVTPHDTPSSPAGFASVFPHGQGPAPYDIQAPSPQGAVQSAFSQSVADAGAGVLYQQSERQRQTEVLLTSDAGYGTGGMDIQEGYHGVIAGDPGWPVNVE